MYEVAATQTSVPIIIITMEVRVLEFIIIFFISKWNKLLCFVRFDLPLLIEAL